MVFSANILWGDLRWEKELPEPFKLISGATLLAGAAALEVRVIVVVLFWDCHGARVL